MLRTQIMDQIKEAMKAKDSVKLDALRYLWSEIKNAEIDAKMELDDAAIQALVVKEVKKRKEAIEQIKAGGGNVAEEEVKLKFIEAYQPQMMSKEEIGEIVDQIIGVSAEKDFGKVMGQVMARVKGKADGKLVGDIVKTKLS